VTSNWNSFQWGRGPRAPPALSPRRSHPLAGNNKPMTCSWNASWDGYPNGVRVHTQAEGLRRRRDAARRQLQLADLLLIQVLISVGMHIKTGGRGYQSRFRPNADNGDVAATRVRVRVLPHDELALGPNTAPDRLVHRTSSVWKFLTPNRPNHRPLSICERNHLGSVVSAARRCSSCRGNFSDFSRRNALQPDLSLMRVRIADRRRRAVCATSREST